MANKKISELPSATTPLDDTDLFEVVQDGINKKVAKSDVSSGGSGIWGSITGTLSDQTDLQAALDAKLAIAAFAPYIIDQATTSTAGGTITLDMNSQKQRSHVGSAVFGAAKIIALSNTTNSLFFNFIFEVTSTGSTLTFPADWLSSSPDFNGTLWTPPTTGKFEFGGSFDDVNNLWYIKVSGPFI